MMEWIISSSILILVLAGLRHFLGNKIRLSLRYALWALVLARLLVPFQFGSSPISVQNPVEKAPVVQQIQLAEKVEHFVYHEDGTATGYYQFEPVWDHDENSGKAEPVEQEFTTQQAQTLTQVKDVWKIAKTWLLRVWIAGMAVTGFVFLLSNLRFARRLRRSRRLLEKNILPVYVTEAVETPCLFGLFRPAIYLTRLVAEEPRHRQYAVAHELTHHRHGDGIWSALRCVCLVLHWYNPLVWWAAALSREDGELACDEKTIAALGEEHRADYGRVLIDLTCRKRTDLLRAATMMTGSGKSLKQRITLIAKKPKMAVYTLIAVLLVAVVAVGCTFTGGKDPTTSLEGTNATSPTDITSSGDETEPSQAWEALLPTAMEEDGRVVMPTGVPEDEPPENAVPLTVQEMDALYVRFQPGMGIWEFQAVLATLFGDDYDAPGKVPIGSFLSKEMGAPVTDEAELASLPWESADGICKITGTQLNDLLMTCFDITLEETEKRDMEQMYYREDTDTYYYRPVNDEVVIEKVFVDYGYRDLSGVIYLDAYITIEGRYKIHWCRVMMLPNEQGQYRIYSVREIYYEASHRVPPATEAIEDVHNSPGTALEDEELAYFQELFASGTGADNINYYNIILFCGYGSSGGFVKPENINLRTLFNNGFWENGNYLAFTEEEQAFIESENMVQELDIFKLPVVKMDQVLRDYLGITFEQSHKVAFYSNEYFQATNCYFGYASGAAGVLEYTMLHGSREENGTVHLICLVNEYPGTTVKLTLRPTSEGAAQPYHVLACYKVEPCK